MKYYFVSDLHGSENALHVFLNKTIKDVEKGKAKLFFLGDYIDRGKQSFQVLNSIYNLQKQYGNEKIIVLRGNHEEAFIEFIKGENNYWLVDDRYFSTIKTFLTENQLDELKEIALHRKTDLIIDFVIKTISSNHKELIEWLNKLPYFYETEKQIIVHAGIDEEAEELWRYGTPDFYFVCKNPLTTGKFYKDIICGHISSAAIANNNKYLGKVYFDGENHYFIDGTILKSKKLPVLVFDAEAEMYSDLQLGVGDDSECY